MRFMRWALVGVIAVLISCGGESSPTTSDSSLASTVTETKDEYNVGDIGPGGGIIFYVDEAGFDNSLGDDVSIGAMCLTGTCHYLEMAPTDLDGVFLLNEAIGAADNFATASADDWALPSLDALNEICKYAFGDTVNDVCNDNGAGALSLMDGFQDGYWSSSKTADGSAWRQYFDSGAQDDYLKDSPYSVRPVRAF